MIFVLYKEYTMKQLLVLIVISATISANINDPLPCTDPNLIHRGHLLNFLPKNGIVAEIGVEQGDFAQDILNYTNPKMLYLIDCWEGQTAEQCTTFYSQSVEDQFYERVKQRFANEPRVKIIKAYSPEAAELFENEFFDWVYIDANHRYEAVKKDLDAWWAKVKHGGYMAGDDYGVSPLNFGVIRAVNEFLQKHNLVFSLLTNHAFANYAIRKE